MSYLIPSLRSMALSAGVLMAGIVGVHRADDDLFIELHDFGIDRKPVLGRGVYY